MLRRTALAVLAAPLLARAQAPRAVVASFSILGDLARQVLGPGAALSTMAGPDVDAHHFQTRPSHITMLRGAAMAIRNGWGFDGWFNRAAQAANFSGTMVTATEGLTARPAPRGRGTHSHGPNDPHAWQDVSAARHYLRQIAAGAARAGIPADATAADARLAALDAWVRAQIATVPEARRIVVTSHDAFGYFGAAYGVRFLAPQGVSTQAEPSAQAVAALIRQVRAQNITAVFMENMTNPATLNRLAAEAGVTVRGRLYADALSRADGPAADYEAMMRHNVTLMVSAMRG
jgi:zinc/manganese transport system substrate-binding protein